MKAALVVVSPIKEFSIPAVAGMSYSPLSKLFDFGFAILDCQARLFLPELLAESSCILTVQASRINVHRLATQESHQYHSTLDCQIDRQGRGGRNRAQRGNPSGQRLLDYIESGSAAYH